VSCGGGCHHTPGAWRAASKLELHLSAKSLLWYIRSNHDGTHWCRSTSLRSWSWEIHLLSVVSLLWFRAKALRCRCLLWAPIFLFEGRKGNLVLLVLWQLLGLLGALVVLALYPPTSVVLPSVGRHTSTPDCTSQVHLQPCPSPCCVCRCVLFLFCLPLVTPCKLHLNPSCNRLQSLIDNR
jgi:hypothetical protein